MDLRGQPYGGFAEAPLQMSRLGYSASEAWWPYDYAAIDPISATSFVRIVDWRASICN